MSKQYRVFDKTLTVKYDNEKKVYRGYAAVFNRTSQDRGGYKDVFAPSIFSRYLSDPSKNVFAYGNHNSDIHLGSRSTGRLKLQLDQNGLAFELDPIDTVDGDKYRKLIDGNEIQGVSVGIYFAHNDTKIETINGEKIRTIFHAELYEISLVADPAFADAYVGAYSNEFAPLIEPDSKIPKSILKNKLRIAELRGK